MTICANINGDLMACFHIIRINGLLPETRTGRRQNGDEDKENSAHNSSPLLSTCRQSLTLEAKGKLTLINQPVN
jgi:hypothetical protein